MENFLKIRNKNSELIPFKLNQAQLDMDKHIKRCEKDGLPKRFIILKARQLGFSTFTEGVIFHDTSTKSFRNSLIIAHEDKATQNIFNMSKLFYDELEIAIRPLRKYSNGKELTFENNTNNEAEKRENPGLRSKITVATAGTVEVGRSGTIHNVHASEVAFFPDGDTTMLGILQSVPDTPNTLVVLESTANGVGGYFYDMWQKAVKGENDYIPLFYPWFTDPNYRRDFPNDEVKKDFIDKINRTFLNDKKEKVHTEEYLLMKKNDLTYEQLYWREFTIRNKCNNDVEKFRQEYPSNPDEAFTTSGRPVFNQERVRDYLNNVKTCDRGYLEEDIYGNVSFIPDEKGYLYIKEYPSKEKDYCIGSDVAEGIDSGDYSVGIVGDYDYNLVCMWYGHIDPDLYGNELYKLGKFYNNAYLGVENNNHGLTTLKALQKLGYDDLFFTKTYDKIVDKITYKLGWTTSGKSKPLMIDHLRMLIREKHLSIPFRIIVDELRTFIFTDKGTMEAQVGSHDDCVMALAILTKIIDEGYHGDIDIDNESNHFDNYNEEEDILGYYSDTDNDGYFGDIEICQ